MAEYKENNLILEHYYDSRSNRHYINDVVSVFHCHHYSSLYLQLAIDAKETALLAGVAEETFFRTLSNYFLKYQITQIADRIKLACQYFAALGLGQMEVVFAGDVSGEVKLLRSHVDEGWIKKWGTYSKPVNYLGVGFIAGMFSAVFGVPIKTYQVDERESIVMGSKNSIFRVLKG